MQGIKSRRIRILHPGVALPADLRGIDAAAFRHRLGIGPRPLLLSVGRLTARKGLPQFVRYCLPRLVAAHRDLLLLIVGGAADEQLSDTSIQIREAVTREAAALGLSHHLMFTGKVDDSTLAQAWRASQLHVFPVLDLPGDVEGFGMVALEAAAHGLPTIGFAAGGVPDAIADGRSGVLVRPGDYEGMTNAIMLFLNGGHPRISPENCIAFARPKSWPAFGEQLRAICHSTLRSPP
jgi:phosphatidylinositol alpha-1,6-mannosyltransferase